MTMSNTTATFNTCHHEGETYTMGVGRARERADVLDFIRHPPGSLPLHVRGSMAELATAISAGRHSGDAERLYEDLPWLRDRVDECATEMARLRAEVKRLENELARAKVAP